MIKQVLYTHYLLFDALRKSHALKTNFHRKKPTLFVNSSKELELIYNISALVQNVDIGLKNN